jgi:hypothetical protein
MTSPVASIKYRSEFIRSFNQTVSLLSDRCTDESMSQGVSAVFDVTDLGGDLGERGVDGNLPRLTSTDAQVTATLKEYGGYFEITNFDAFTSQSDERAKMNAKIMARTNRRMDKALIAELDNATTNWNGGAAVVMTPAIATAIITSLEQNAVPVNPQDVTVVATPKVRHQLMKAAAYASSDYVTAKPYTGDAAIFANERKIKSWLDVGWIFSPILPGMGTATAKCYIFHRNAIGCAKPTEQFRYAAGYEEKHHKHFASVSAKMAFKILQQGGVIEIIHDDTAA